MTIWLERRFYDAHDPPPLSKRSWFRPWRLRYLTPTPTPSYGIRPSFSRHSEPPAIVVNHLTKTFRTSIFTKFIRPWRLFLETDPDDVTAIADLSFTVPRGGIFILLGSNGAGKSTALGVLAGLIGRTGGSVMFPSPTAPTERLLKDAEAEEWVEWEGPSRPSKGSIGIVPQRNVLFPELTCFQTIQLWSAIKRPLRRRSGAAVDTPRRIHVEDTPEDLERLLVDCGLEGKLHANAGSLSGGQKRKLQLAIGLVGGSESEYFIVLFGRWLSVAWNIVVFVDECTSGVDPLSRRSIWRTLTAVKNERTIVFTTHVS
jgi:ABC-type multidrug transport system ATPase subunit